MTYNVFGGTLNPTLLLFSVDEIIQKLWTNVLERVLHLDEEQSI